MKMSKKPAKVAAKTSSTATTGNIKSAIDPELLTKKSIANLLKVHNEAKPYKHLHIENIFDNQLMRNVQEEALTNLQATFKESDLFKVFQTIDMGNLDNFKPKDKAKMVNLFALKDYLYSSEFRNFVESILGCDGLIDRVDCSMNIYTNSCHLLCHDDVIGTRRVSYIIYLTDADEEWKPSDGGSLELYPLDPSSIITRPESGQQGVPVALPTTNLLPSFNSMALFCVQPGRSYHSVQEVFTDKSRLSISGWFHGLTPIVGSDLASLKQIMTKGDDNQNFTSYPEGIYPSTESQPKKKQKSKSTNTSKNNALSAEDSEQLACYINPEYLKASVMKEINKVFCDQSSLQLKDFLRMDIALGLNTCVTTAESEEGFIQGQCPPSYQAGINAQWSLVGPAHKRRYLQLKSNLSTTKAASDKKTKNQNVAKSSMTSTDRIAQVLHDIKTQLFQSEAFARYLKIVTSLSPRSFRGEVRRFRPGMDYTVAHYGGMTQEPRLDATLCFVKDDFVSPSMEEKKIEQKKNEEDDNDNDDEEDEDEEEEDEDDDDDEEEGGVWSSGDVGGFECYIAADSTEETAEAAEVFQSGYGTTQSKPKQKNKGTSKDDDEENDDEEEEDTSLLSVTPGFNVLSLVLRDDKVMRFIKYVSANAPSSRWDVAYEYEYDN